MNLKRLYTHLSYTPWKTSRLFPRDALLRLHQETMASEAEHRGQVRFCIEATLSLPLLLHNVSPHERALQVFSDLHMWDTEDNCGILIYLLLAESAVEIIADRGINKVVSEDTWHTLCDTMNTHFKKGSFEMGLREGLHEMTSLLAAHFPHLGGEPNELPDKPVLL